MTLCGPDKIAAATAPSLIFRLVGFRLRDFDDTLHRHQTIDARRDGVDPAGEFGGDLHHGVEHVWIDANGGCGAAALDGQVGVDRAARQQFRGAFARCQLDIVPAGRQPHPEIKTLGVD